MPRRVKSDDQKRWRGYLTAVQAGLIDMPLTEDLVKSHLEAKLGERVTPESPISTATIVGVIDNGVRIKIPSGERLIPFNEILGADKIMSYYLPDSLPVAVATGDFRKPESAIGALPISNDYYAPALAELVWREICDASAEMPKAEDLGPAERVETTVSRIIRDTRLSKHIKALHKYRCQICDHTITLADGSNYAEAHHLRPLAPPHDGPDVIENMLCLCPNHHAVLDFGAIRLDPETLRRVSGHTIGSSFIDYHNRKIYRGFSDEPGADSESRTEPEKESR